MKLPSLRRPAAESEAIVVANRQKLVNRAMATPYSEDRVRLQKAAAWQWFMHGAGVEAQPSGTDASATRPPTHNIQKQASRFANEAVVAAPFNASAAASLSLDDDYIDLSTSLAPNIEKMKPSNYGKQKEEELREQGEYFSHSHRTHQELHLEKVKPSNDKQKRHLHFLGFEKLLHKLGMSRGNKKILDSARRPATAMPDEEEVQHHYHHYIHHHHHHYYRAGTCSLEEVELVRHSHPPYIEHKRMRRHSESGSFYQPHLELCQGSLSSSSGCGEEEDEDYKMKGDSHVFRRHSHNFSKDELQHPIKAFTSEEEIVVGQPLHMKYPSRASAKRHNSERFTTTSGIINRQTEARICNTDLLVGLAVKEGSLQKGFINFYSLKVIRQGQARSIVHEARNHCLCTRDNWTKVT